MSIKRCIWGLLTAVLVSISNPLDASAKDFVYNYLGVNFKCKVKNGKTTIIAFDRDAAEVKIPAEVRDKHNISYQVSMISLFSEATYYKATTVVIERGITEIDEYCFQYFKELNAIYIPNSVEKIGKKAFNPKYAPTFTMPGSIKESDLLAGNAVYPQNTPIQVNPTEGLDLSDYTNESEDVKPKGGINMNFQLEQGVAITPGTSDIDRDIPFGKQKRENTFCIIIANEDYTQKDTPGVKYAMQDGKTFQNYCYRTLGLPRNNVRFVGNASYLQTKELLRWLQQVAEVYGTDANFLVYYAGHGVPDEKGNCKLIPADVSINDVHNGIALKELYDTLGKLTTNNVLVMIDACFSGNDRGDVAALDETHRGIVREVKNEIVTGNVVVLTAASNTETALSYEEQAHGMFSYFLMKKLQETKGDVTFGELYEYVKKSVKRKSTVDKMKTQTPSVSYSSNLEGKWMNLKF